jgi:hypothetical protein
MQWVDICDGRRCKSLKGGQLHCPTVAVCPLKILDSLSVLIRGCSVRKVTGPGFIPGTRFEFQFCSSQIAKKRLDFLCREGDASSITARIVAFVCDEIAR